MKELQKELKESQKELKESQALNLELVATLKEMRGGMMVPS